MSDFDEGMAVGLAIGRKKFSGSGGTYRNAVFHDIVDNSDTLLTVPVDDHYRITVNFWVTDRTDVYGSYMNTFFGMIFENENEGYGTRVNWLSKKA